MTYKDILNSDFFFDTYSKIEFLKRDFPVNHGFVHVWHVIKWAKKLANIFSLSSEETDLLLISACLHDIGYLNGRDDHAKSGSVDAKIYLTAKTNKDIDRICNAIANQSGESPDDFIDNISMCLVLADKFDFDKTRYREDGKHKSVEMFMSIEKTDLIKIDGEYNFEIYTTNLSLFTDLENNHFFKKLNRVLNNLYLARNIKINIKFVEI